MYAMKRNILFFCLLLASSISYSQEIILDCTDNVQNTNEKFLDENKLTVQSNEYNEEYGKAVSNMEIVDVSGYKYSLQFFSEYENWDKVPPYDPAYNAIKICGFDRNNNKSEKYYNNLDWITRVYSNNKKLKTGNTPIVKFDMASSCVIAYSAMSFFPDAPQLTMILLKNGKSQVVYNRYTYIADCDETSSWYDLKVAVGCVEAPDGYDSSVNGEYEPEYTTIRIHKDCDKIEYFDCYPVPVDCIIRPRPRL